MNLAKMRATSAELERQMARALVPKTPEGRYDAAPALAEAEGISLRAARRRLDRLASKASK